MLKKQGEQNDREEHLEWCKQRALDYARSGNLDGAWASMVSDLNKHPETYGHPAINLGAMLMMSGNLNTKDEIIKFIEGFN